MVNQIIEIRTAAGVEQLDADRYFVDGTDYVFYHADQFVRRVDMDEIVDGGEDAPGIQTVFSRSMG